MLFTHHETILTLHMEAYTEELDLKANTAVDMGDRALNDPAHTVGASSSSALQKLLTSL